MFRFKKWVLYSMVIIFTLAISYSATSYSGASITSDANLRIVDSKNALIAVESGKITVTAGTKSEGSIKVTNHTGSRITNIILNVDNITGHNIKMAFEQEGQDCFETLSGIGQPVELKYYVTVDGQAGDYTTKAQIIAQWNGGSAVINDVPVEVKVEELVKPNSIPAASSEGQEPSSTIQPEQTELPDLPEKAPEDAEETQVQSKENTPVPVTLDTPVLPVLNGTL